MVAIRYRIRIPVHYSTFLAIVEDEILADLLVFLIRSPADFHDADAQHFGSNPADIRIRINCEIWIRIPDHLRLRFDALAEVCAL